MAAMLAAGIERDLAMGLLVGSVPGVPGAQTQGESAEEVRQNLVDVLDLVRSNGALQQESDFIATMVLRV